MRYPRSYSRRMVLVRRAALKSVARAVFSRSNVVRVGHCVATCLFWRLRCDASSDSHGWFAEIGSLWHMWCVSHGWFAVIGR